MTEKESVSVASDENCATINLQIFVCSVCGEDHETEYCAVVGSLKLVHDSKILSRARQTLPKILEVISLADGSTTVITNVKIEQGTQFGPFQAPLSLGLPPGVLFPLKVFGKTLDEGYYLDTTDESSCNWMCLVATAASTREQNLICYDVKQSIYFATTRDIHPGEELRLWYALYYGLKLQALPLADDSMPEVGFCDLSEDNNDEETVSKSSSGTCVVRGGDLLQTLAQYLPAHALGASGERDVWICKLCGQQETNVANYARHLMTHYHQPTILRRNLLCEICDKRFLCKKMFERHMSNTHASKPENVRNLCFSVSCDGPQSNGEQHVRTSSVDGLQKMKHEYNVDGQNGNSLGESPKNDNIVCCNQISEIPKQMGDLKHGVINDKVLERSCNLSLQRENSNSAVGQPDDGGQDCTHLDFIGDEGDSSELTQSAPMYSCRKELNQSEDADKFHMMRISESQNAVKLNSKTGANSKENIIVHSNNEDSSSSSFEFAQSVGATLESGEPIAFIVVESSNGNEVSAPALDGNIMLNSISYSGSTLQDDINGHHSLTEQNGPNKVTKLDQQVHHIPPDKKILPFNCDICQKSFGKCSYLYRHLRKHTGEFTCVTCLAVFARKENLETHSCSQPKKWFPCPTCGKKFSAKKYLQRHTPMHTGEFSCSDCKRHFVSRLSLKFHRCTNGKASTKMSSINCFMCERVFPSETKLKTHLKVHSDMDMEVNSANPFSSQIGQQLSKLEEKSSVRAENGTSEVELSMCEICGAVFKSSSSLKMHRYCHGEKNFECETCKKRFYRKDVLQEHLKVHQDANYPCQSCGKKYKTKKSLYVHSFIHAGQKRFTCEICGKKFFQKGNLGKHMQTHNTERTYICSYCNKSFYSKEYFAIHELTHTQGKIHRCSECKRSFVKKHLLDTHRLLFHSNQGYLCKFCNSVIRHRHSVRRHLEKTHSDHIQEWSLPGFIDMLMVKLPQELLQSVGDTKLTQEQQQKRQQQLELLRKQHFQNKCLSNIALVDTEFSSDFVYSQILSSEQLGHHNQKDPLIIFQQPPQQLALMDNLLPDYDEAQTVVSGQSVLESDDVHDSAGEILLTLVNQDTHGNASTETAPVLNDMMGIDSGTTCMLGDGNNSVLLYVVESSNGDEEDHEDLVWCDNAISAQL